MLDTSRQTAAVAIRILGGEKASAIKIPSVKFSTPKFDWRELQRWKISEARLPPGSIVQFREPSVWQRYRWQLMTIFAALLIQAAIITWLLLERRRRRNAELESRRRLLQVMHLSRTAEAGALSASFAHIAFDEPGLMGRRVFFGVAAHGYEFAKDGFGIRGVVLEPKPGGSARLKIRRLNIAERLYRITGYGIYRDLGPARPEAAGRRAAAQRRGDRPGRHPQRGLQGQALLVLRRHRPARLRPGQLRHGRGHDRPAREARPGRRDRPQVLHRPGWLREAHGPDEGEGVVWLFGLAVLPDESGRERMIAYFHRRRGLGPCWRRASSPITTPRTSSRSSRMSRSGRPYSHRLPVPRPGPRGRVRQLHGPIPGPAGPGRLEELPGPRLVRGLHLPGPGTRYVDKDKARLERDGDGRLVWAWKRDTPPLGPKEQQGLIEAGKMRREESPFRLQDADGGKPIVLNNSSCFWNGYRKKYILIASEHLGATALGEVWYSEADRPEGPWVQPARSSRTRTSRATPTTSTTRRSTRSSTARAAG